MKIMTEWGEKLDRNHPLQEYPRPQMERSSYLNLNGVWNYAITKTMDTPSAYDGEIVVPFAPECVLSGVEKALGFGNFPNLRLGKPAQRELDVGQLLLAEASQKIGLVLGPIRRFI